jgi:hypothetical protein
MRKPKRPNGWVLEEYITASAHLFENGQFQLHDDDQRGSYTGRIAFEYMDHKTTRWYRKEKAPMWLREMWAIAMRGRQ